MLELRCHFETGNVKNHSCVPVACMRVCSLGYSVILIEGKKTHKTRIQFIFRYQFGSIHFQFLSNVLLRYMVGMNEMSV